MHPKRPLVDTAQRAGATLTKHGLLGIETFLFDFLLLPTVSFFIRFGAFILSLVFCEWTLNLLTFVIEYCLTSLYYFSTFVGCRFSLFKTLSIPDEGACWSPYGLVRLCYGSSGWYFLFVASAVDGHRANASRGCLLCDPISKT